MYNHSVVILNPNGSELARSPQPSPINVIAGRPGLIAFGAIAIPVVAGRRIVRLLVNERVHFENSFMIRQAQPQELAGMPGARLQ